MHFRRLRPAVAVLAFASGAILSPAAAPIPAESTISGVTVYGDRAIVTRTAKVDLPAGSQEILFPGLPATLDPDLLQVSGTGDAEVLILEVRALDAQLEKPANPRLKELQDQLRAVETELRVLTDREATLKLERDFLERIKLAATTPPGKDSGPAPGLDQWERLVRFYADAIANTATRAQDIDREKESVLNRRHAIQREINQLQPGAAQAVTNVVVRLDVTKAGGMDVRLAYTVREASWAPTYDVRLNAAEKKVRLGYFAMVRQSTGEDWHAANLTLSTARPAVGGTPPELSPWHVTKLEPRPMAEADFGGGGTRAGAVTTAAPAMDAAKAVMVPLEVHSAQVEQGLTAATFVLPRPTDVPADNAEHKIPITAHTLDATLTHYAVPKLAELVYLRAAVENTSGYPLLAGPLNLFLDGTFVARSHLRTVMAQEKFDLDLGVDDAVSIHRELRNRFHEDTGNFTSWKKITYDVLVTVQNNRPEAIQFVMKDQLPVAGHERIKVKLEEPPSRVVTQEADGTLTWKLELAPREKRELPLKISVEYPAEFMVEGLE